jgi:hypothetical protein
VIEVEVVGASALDTPALVTLPDSELHVRRDETRVQQVFAFGRRVSWLLLVRKFEPELARPPSAGVLNPSID